MSTIGPLLAIQLLLSSSQAVPNSETKLRTTVPLVVLPTSVTDGRGRSITGLEASDFTVLENGKAKTIHVDPPGLGAPPIFLVLTIQMSGMNSGVLSKLQKMGGLIAEGVVGSNCQVLILGFDERVQVLQDFTSDPDLVARTFEGLKLSSSAGGHMLDAVSSAIDSLSARQGTKRSSILIIGQSRDRGSETEISFLLPRLQRSNITVYGMSYSAFLTAFTTKPDEYELGGMGGNYLAALTEAARLSQKNTMKVLVEATGGKQMSFETRQKLENELLGLGDDLHNRYLLSFTPEESERTSFHRVQVHVKGRADAVIKTRPGFWTGPDLLER